MARKSIKIGDLIGGHELLKTFINNHSAFITSKGLSPSGLVTAVDAQKADLANKDGAQEDAKSALRNATLAVEASVNANYPQWSSLIDLLRGAFGTTTPEGKQLTNMRKGVIGKGGGGSGGTTSSSTSGSGSGSSSGSGGSSSSSS